MSTSKPCMVCHEHAGLPFLPRVDIMLENRLIELNARDNQKIKHLRGLCEQASHRRKSQQTVLEGNHLIDAWLNNRQDVVSFFATAQALQHPEAQQLLARSTHYIYVVPEPVYKELRTLGPGIDLMAVIDLPQQQTSINYQADMLILENLQDPGNVGTLLRTAAAAGIKQVVCTAGTAAIWSPRVLRAGMGAQFSLQVYEKTELADLLQHIQTPLYATSSHAQQSLYQLNLRQPCAWLLGNEGQGASELAISSAQAIGIPQPGGQESLNVAIAGAICMYEMVRQRLS